MNDMNHLKTARFTDILRELIDNASKHLNTINGMAVEDISNAYKKRLDEFIGPHLFEYKL
jgi:hypothetical protein